MENTDSQNTLTHFPILLCRNKKKEGNFNKNQVNKSGFWYN